MYEMRNINHCRSFYLQFNTKFVTIEYVKFILLCNMEIYMSNL